MTVSLFDQACKAWDENELKTAFELFREAVAQGMYWYKKAALQYNDLAAYTNIALCYKAKGDFKCARHWCLEAFKKGDKSAALDLAKLGLEGKVNLLRVEIIEYLQIVIDAETMVEVCESEQEEALLLLEQLENGLIPSYFAHN